MFTRGFRKVAVSVGLIDKLTASGTRKRLDNLYEKNPEKLQDWVNNLNRTSSNMSKAVKSSMTPHDIRLLLSSGRSEAHYKDLSPTLRTTMRYIGKAMMPPKV